jgi:hypothetical protein
MVDTQKVCINAIILNERILFFWPKAHKRSGTALVILTLLAEEFLEDYGWKIEGCIAYVN